MSTQRKRNVTSRSVGFAAAAMMLTAVHADSLPEAELDAVFNTRLSDGPGCVGAAYRNGAIAYAKGFGYANVEHRVPISADTVFDIGSVSKQFTAMAVIMLAQEGRLGLDDDIRRHLADLPDYGQRVTIRHLIHHTGGVRNYFDLLFMKGLNLQDPVTPDEAYRLITRHRTLDFAPGTRFAYSNSGYFLLGRIVERISGQMLGAFLRDRVFDPLGMKNTHVHDVLGRIVPGRAYGYVGSAQKGFRAAESAGTVTGDGAIFTTVRDLQRYDEDFYAGKVWRPAIKSEMLRVGMLSNGRPAGFDDSSAYAAGLNVGVRRGLRFVNHQGKNLGFTADFTRYPEQHVSTIVLCNSIINATAFSESIADIVLRDRYTADAPKDAAGGDARPSPSRHEPLSAEFRKEIAGTYYSDELEVEYTVRSEADALLIEIGSHRMKYAGPFHALGRDAMGDARMRFEFRRAPAGRITGFDLQGVEFRRVN